MEIGCGLFAHSELGPTRVGSGSDDKQPDSFLSAQRLCIKCSVTEIGLLDASQISIVRAFYILIRFYSIKSFKKIFLNIGYLETMYLGHS